MKPATVLVLAALAAVAANCGSASDARDCSVAEVHQLVRSFISAFNSGDTARLDRIFATAARFKWYSTDGPGKRLGAAAYDRSTLIRYFASRHARRERLIVRQWSGNGNANGYFHFQFRLIREARGLRPTNYEGKGAIICSSRGDTIAVWSMGREH